MNRKLFLTALILGLSLLLGAPLMAATWSEEMGQSQTALDEGDAAAAKNSAQKALKLAKPGTEEEALSLAILGMVAMGEGQYQEATEHLSKSKKILDRSAKGQQSWLDVSLQLAELQGATGDFAGAEATYSQLLRFFNENLGESDLNSISLMVNLAKIEEALGKYEEGLKLLKKALTLQENLAAGDPELFLSSLEGLASMEKRMGKLDEAKARYQQVMKLKEQTFGAKSEPVLVSLRNIGEIELQKGDFAAAKKTLTEALDGLRALDAPNQDEVHQSMGSLAEVLEALGDYAQAEKLYFAVLKYDRATYGEMDMGTIVDINNMAGIFRKQGKYDLAEKNYQKSLELIGKLLGKDHPETLSLQNNLALLYENMGFFDQAEPLFKESFSSLTKTLGSSHPKVLDTMNNLAMLHEGQGVFSKAERLYLQLILIARQQFGTGNIRVMTATNNLAYLYLMQSKFQQAHTRFEQVVQSWTKQLGPEHQKTLKAKNSLGRSLHGLGKLDEALAILEEALEQRKSAFGERHPDSIRSMIDLGGLLIDLKKFQRAKGLLSQAVLFATEQLGDKHQYTFDALNRMAELEEAMENLDEAIKIRYDIFQRRNVFFKNVLWATGENTRQGYIQLHRHEQDNLVRLLAKKGTDAAAALAFDVSLQRKGLLLQIASAIQKVVRMQDDEELKFLAMDLTDKRKELAELTLAGPQKLTPASFNRRVQILEEEVEALERKLGTASRAFQNTVQVIGVDDVTKKLPLDHALVDFLQFQDGKENRMIAIVAQKKKSSCYLFMECDQIQVKMVPIGKIANLKENVQYFRMAIQDMDTDEEDLEYMGEAVLSRVWTPIEKVIGETKKVYVVPDSYLHLLPFDAIPNGNGEYLAQAYDLKVLSSAKDVVLSTDSLRTGQFLIMAGPDYDLKTKVYAKQQSGMRSALQNGIRLAPEGLRSLSFDPLLGAKIEGETLKQVADDHKALNEIFVERAAEEIKLRELTEPPLILHVATHGFFLAEAAKLKRRLLGLNRGGVLKPPPPADNPLLRAGLAFAGINANAPFLGEIDTENDGVLTALEVLSLNLQGTNLVVLSACETGVGEIHAGEGVYGLRRSFQEAGVTNVVNSLWPVSDEATKLLMSRFYKEIYQGKNAREALRLAQEQLIQSDDWNHPYYWAAFVLVGKG